MMDLIEHLWMKNRSLVTDDFDESLDYIKRIIDIKIHEIPSGTECWKWIIPEKWVVRDAYISDGEKKIVDFKDNPLHVISYSLPIDKEITKEELMSHLYWNENRPKAIPFMFKYYERDWGFCIQYEKVKTLNKDKYKVYIDAKFEKGALKVGELEIPGKCNDTIVLISHLCHPAQANDDLSGVAVAVELAKMLGKRKKTIKHTYKFLFVPETIGSIAYLSQNENLIPRLKYGIFLEMLGNDNDLILQHSWPGTSRIDRVARYVLKRVLGDKYREGDFRKVVGNDEMVLNGPGVNVPTISISRWPYPEYHTSDDNPSIINEKRLKEAKDVILKIIEIMDKDWVPVRTFRGPILLSRYGLWVDWRTNMNLNRNIEYIMLSLEGDLSIFDIAEKFDMDFNSVFDYVSKFLSNGLVKIKKICDS